MIRLMMRSFSRLVRQVFVGAGTRPASQAVMGGGASAPAPEGALKREDLKRAMEIAFASPLEPETGVVASPLEPETGIIVEMKTLEEEVRELEAAMAQAPVAVREQTTEPPDVDVVEPVAIEHVNEPIAHDEPVAEDEPIAEEVSVVEEEEVAQAEATEIVTELAETNSPESVVVEAETETAPAQEVAASTADVDIEPKRPFDPEEAARALAELIEVTADGDDVPEPTDEGESTTAAEIAPIEAPAAAAEQTGAEEDAVPDIAEPAAAEAPAKPARAKKAAAKKKPAAKKKAATKKAASPRKTAAPATLDDGVWLTDAVAYTLSGAWSSTWSPPEDSSGVERLAEFRTKAAEGGITIWGRADGAPEWTPIKASYWKSGVIDPLSFFMGREDVEAEPKAANGKPKKGVKYVGLKISKAAVEELWPAQIGQDEVRNAA